MSIKMTYYISDFKFHLEIIDEKNIVNKLVEAMFSLPPIVLTNICILINLLS